MPAPPQTAERLLLPDVPVEQFDLPVACWSEPVSMPTYLPDSPDRYPMFLDSRVYQGSSGKVYPLPVVGRVSPEALPRQWQAVHLENQWLRLMVLPELGGRIHVGYDKTAGYDFFYRQDVIKPALVGLAGPWLSGGVELNWPQHHRPATFLPVDVEIERHLDGAVTVWCSDHDPFARMKGMHGVRLHPDRAVVELVVRLYNRSEDVQTFLWWANVAVRVHDRYQTFFPTDVRVVADHARRAMTAFPRADRPYYGVDYPSLVSPETPDADRLDWWSNIPVPTSYMCVGSEDDFFGGYDHAAEAGLVHWADHRVSPGKKQWTWGNSSFGEAWERNLTDGGGPYVELMAGVFTDNQPDFAFLAPGETKAFSQYWYPIHRTGPVQQATTEVAVSLVREPDDPTARVAVAVTRARPSTVVTLFGPAEEPLQSWHQDLAPGVPLVADVVLDPKLTPQDLCLVVEHGGETLLEHRPRVAATSESVAAPATEPPAPADIDSVDRLYLTGLHLSQYRHATRSPEPYWEEALRRDSGESRCRTALGAHAYRRGEYDVAEDHLRAALARLNERNANPYDGEPLYRLGLVLRRTGRLAEAASAFGKATWNDGWCGASLLALAELACARQRWLAALVLLEDALRRSTDDLRARNLRSIVLGKLGRHAEAREAVDETLRLDPLDVWARHLAGRTPPQDPRSSLDVALDLARAGLTDESLDVLDAAEQRAALPRRPGDFDGLLPVLAYHRARLLDGAGRHGEAAEQRGVARSLDQEYCFPSGLDDHDALRAALRAAPHDARAASLLGTWLYDRGRKPEALESWRAAVDFGADDPVTWRNLGMASWNVESDAVEAARCYDHALLLAPEDARLCFERDQLARRTGTAPSRRVDALADREHLVSRRDDLTVELAEALVTCGRPMEARELLERRQLQPWEGGEGRALGVHERIWLSLSRQALLEQNPTRAVACAQRALEPPSSLGEGRHPLANASRMLLALGDSLISCGEEPEARRAWHAAATQSGDFRDMSSVEFSDLTLYTALAWRRLGEEDRAVELLKALDSYGQAVSGEPACVDYFATSLPSMLLFPDEPEAAQRKLALRLQAQAAWGLGDNQRARNLLVRLLAEDPNDPVAADLSLELES